MSVIVVRNGIMACDGLLLDGEQWDVSTTDYQKIHRLRDGSLFGGVGSSGHLEEFASAMRRHPIEAASMARSLFGSSKTYALRLMPRGSILSYDAGGETPYPASLRYHSIGAGAGAALGAMDMGASARQACAIAINRNMGARGRVQWLKLARLR